MITVAALFVASGGVYFGIHGVDPWDEPRDARRYYGPHPVVAHPPCERWGRYAGDRVGLDDGCFAAALAAVRTHGGVIEHPADSLAWRSHGLAAPPRRGGWVTANDDTGWTCCVEQGHYGHRARKATWLYVVRARLIPLTWGASQATIVPRPGRDPVRERRTGAVQRMSRKQRRETPVAFRDQLLAIARSVYDVTRRRE